MRGKPQIKPFNAKEIERIDSGIVTDYVIIIFFWNTSIGI